jgi:hypothetical protein
MRSLRLITLLALLCAALVAVGCGGDDNKDSKTTASTPAAAETTATTPATSGAGALAAGTYQTIITGATSLGTNLKDIGSSIATCTKKATNGLDAVRQCIADKLQGANGEIEKLADTVEGAESGATGECQTQLKAFATALRQVVSTFASGAKEIGGGDVQKGIAAVQDVDVSGLSTSGNAVQTSCKPSTS